MTETKTLQLAYARISRRTQNIERQITNITKAYPDAIIYKEAFTGTKIEGRKEFNKMIKRAKENSSKGISVSIIFDSVSRMSRNAEDGISLYFELFDSGIDLIYLKEGYINTSVYRESLKDKIELQGTDEDEIFKGLNNYFRKLAQRQIRIAFEQSEKEVSDLHERTKEGIREARRNGKQIGGKQGAVYHIKKKDAAMEQIKKYSKDFNGSLNDLETMAIVKIAKNTYYKYKRELFEQLA